jgi:hypothetical protein
LCQASPDPRDIDHQKDRKDLFRADGRAISVVTTGSCNSADAISQVHGLLVGDAVLLGDATLRIARSRGQTWQVGAYVWRGMAAAE